MGHWIKPSLATSLPTWHGGIRRPSNLPHGGWAAVAIALLVFSTSASWAQAPVPSRSDTKLDGDASKEAGTTSPPPPQAESQSGKASAVYNGVGAVKNFFKHTPTLRAGSGVKGGPTVFVGPFIARPFTLRTARYSRVRTKRSFVLTRDSFAASDQDSSP